MSAINTSPIDTNYPIPGVNNSTLGFRTNFVSIKNNLDQAATEINELQDKAIVKTAITGTFLDNDMNNTLISNALTKGFRRTTYNLGNNLNGTVIIDVTRGDIQYGTVTANTTLSFSKWPPAGTQANVELMLTVSSHETRIVLPNQVDNSKLFLENFTNDFNAITGSHNGYKIHVRFYTDDCGTTLFVEPVTRARRAAQILEGPPATTDIVLTGTVATDSGVSPEPNKLLGTGTAFLSEADPAKKLLVGRLLLTADDQVIGTVQSIPSDTEIYLVENAAVEILVSAPIKMRIPIGNPGDTVGAIQADEDYMYICSQDYNGIDAIWRRMPFNTY